MRKIYFTMLALFFAVVAAWGQASKGEFSGSFSGKAKYASGKNNYLLDEYKVDYTDTAGGGAVYVSERTLTLPNLMANPNIKLILSE